MATPQTSDSKATTSPSLGHLVGHAFAAGFNAALGFATLVTDRPDDLVFLYGGLVVMNIVGVLAG